MNSKEEYFSCFRIPCQTGLRRGLDYITLYIGESQVLVPCGHIIPSNHSTNNYQRCPICKTNIDNSLKATLDSSIVPALK